MTGKSTRRALLTSALAILACVAMLVGTTFAWFTDTASTAVNTITSGRLDVALEMKNPHYDAAESGSEEWISAENVMLNFLKVEGEQILWEPGCTYRLPELRVVNKGNLALKYKIVITGIAGNAKLNEVIDWTINDEPMELTEQHLAAGEAGAAFTIQGHMWETAGNDYQDLSIDGISLTVYAAQDTVEYDSNGNDYDASAEYPTITTGASVEEVFGDADIDLGYNNDSTEAITLDGKGVTVVSDWTDAWINSDTTIKGMTFKNGAVFSAKADNVTVTLENCVFYACDQSKLTYTSNNSITNSGAGMCLNLEKSSHSGVKFIVKNCTFVGENNSNLPVYGPRYTGSGTVDAYKKRGHAIALDAICGGGTGTLDSLLIEGCVINGVRGNAIQLYGYTGDITIKDTKINSWGINNGAYTDFDGKTLRDANSAAIRGDFKADGRRTLAIKNVYFGLDEDVTTDPMHKINHVNVEDFSGNTDGTEAAGTYTK